MSTNSEPKPSATCPERTDESVVQHIDWYAPGESRSFVVDGVRVEVRFVGRKGRRGRIAVVGPAGLTD